MYRILTVCSGNICRSPVIEQVLRAAVPVPGLIKFSSAGTVATAGDRMPEQAAELSRRLGGDPDAHAARLVTVDLIEDADLILVAAREHRSAVVSLLPRASRRCFTVREFARLVEGVTEHDLPSGPTTPDKQLVALVSEVASRRGSLPPVDPKDDDVVDPYRQSDEVYNLAGSQLEPALGVIASALRVALTPWATR